jgi:putative ABC transport system permease protein
MWGAEFWGEIADSLWRHKLRSALTSFSVFWGMLMLVLLLGAGTGLRRGVEFQFRDDAIHSIWLYPGTTAKPWRGLPTGRDVRFRNADLERVDRTEPAVDRLTGRFYLSGNVNVSRGRKANPFPVRCVHPDHRYLENTQLLEGRFLNAEDLSGARKACVIGTEVRDYFFEGEASPLGAWLTVKGVPYRVVGVFEDAGGRNENKQVYLPVSTAQRVEGGTDRLHQIMFTVEGTDLAGSRAMAERLRADFAREHRFDPTDEQALYVSNNLEEYRRFQGLFAGIEGFVWVIGILSLIAGIIGISNIMLISVSERTREIGVRKALGATDGSLVRLILAEAVTLTALAGFLGLGLGVGLLWAADVWWLPADPGPETMFRNPGVTPGVVLAALTVLVGSGALAGLIPALKAVRVPPAEAMKAA